MIARSPGNIADALRLSALRFGERELLLFGGRRFTYAEFNARVNRLARGLAGAGVEREDVVASMSHNCDALLALYFALAKLGAVSVPLNTMLTPTDVAGLLDRSGARAFVYGPDCADWLPQRDGLQLIAIEPDRTGHGFLADLEAAGGDSELPLAPGDDRAAMIIYTSGSTGAPKGCIKSHANVLWSAINCQLETPRALGDVELYAIPLAGVGFANFILPAMLAGARIVLDRFDAQRCLASISSERVTHTFLAGSMLDGLLRAEGQESVDLSSLKLIETAYRLSERLRAAIAARFGPIVRWCYGSTEGTNWAAPAEVFMTRTDCVGLPKGLDEFRIVDAAGRSLGPGHVGEVLVSGPTIMTGYFDDPAGTAAVLDGGWLRTGDLGELAADGMMLFRGRKKDMIKTGGVNVAAGDVEVALECHPAVAEVAVIGIPDERWGEAVTAVVVTGEHDGGDDELLAELREHCQARLAAFKRPKRYVLVDALPRNPAGKVAKGVLRERYGVEA